MYKTVAHWLFNVMKHKSQQGTVAVTTRHVPRSLLFTCSYFCYENTYASTDTVPVAALSYSIHICAQP